MFARRLGFAVDFFRFGNRDEKNLEGIRTILLRNMNRDGVVDWSGKRSYCWHRSFSYFKDGGILPNFPFRCQRGIAKKLLFEILVWLT